MQLSNHIKLINKKGLSLRVIMQYSLFKHVYIYKLREILFQSKSVNKTNFIIIRIKKN